MSKKHKRKQLKSAETNVVEAEEQSLPRLFLWARWGSVQPTVVWEDISSSCYSTIERFVSLDAVSTKQVTGHGAPLDSLVPKLFRMRRALDEDPSLAPHLQPVISLIENEKRVSLDAMQKSLAMGRVKFDDLWAYLYEGAEVVFDDNGVQQGGIVLSARYSRGFGRLYEVRVACLVLDEGAFRKGSRRVEVPFFEDALATSDLPIRALNAELKARLEARGVAAKRLLANGASYLSYDGDMLRRSWGGSRRCSTTGRIMVDAVTFWKKNPDYSNECDDLEDVSGATATVPLVEAGWMLSPWVLGFSFGTKLWGEINIENIAPVKFDRQAYDQLVLPKRQIGNVTVDVKSMLRSLVEHGSLGFSDFISGKGGGMIFLLHGPPGLGKTLTAEAIADLLHRPLYPVSVGELGTSPEMLEENLRVVLEVAVLWNAVLLFDEADIFLEARTASDIHRNALVSIFLRLLEYYQGILFLTTNRVVNLDEAFHSRVSLALHYTEHGAAERETIWHNLLDAAAVDKSKLDVGALAKAPLNGRQIKNTVRISCAIAYAEGRTLEQNDVEQILALSHQFVLDLGETPTNVRPLSLREGS